MNDSGEIAIGGLARCSLVDFPRRIAAVVFLRGCPWRCPFCHNPALVDPRRAPGSGSAALAETEVMAFLESRRGRLDGVVVSGGEPTLQPGLAGFIDRVKVLGLAVKLDTSGARPAALKRLLEASPIDYVALDVKTGVADYPQLVGCADAAEAVLRSADCLRSSGIDHEFRTTILPGIHTEQRVLAMLDEFRPSQRYVLQPFRPSVTLDPSWGRRPATGRDSLARLAEVCRKRLGPGCDVVTTG